jgi:NAD(P)-dependent dehydrogenase (short-subunit alcohol dehydrogenase family)
MISLEGKVAIVTGGASGMGRAAAFLMAERGAHVVVADIAGDRAAETAEQIGSRGGKAIGCGGDIASEEDWRRIVADVVAACGGIDILYNNAADLRPETYGRDASIALEEMDVALWDHILAVNLRGTMLGCKHVISEMTRRGGGSIINASSNAASSGQETTMAYGASKAGVNALTQYVATAYGQRGIRCNAIAPGLVVSTEVKASLDPDLVRIFEENILTPYTGLPEDVAQVAAFLASDAARYVTGQIIAVDGGLTAHAPYYSDLRRARSDSNATLS